MSTDLDASTFPSLTEKELTFLRPFAESLELDDGDFVFRSGDSELDLFVVEEGGIDIRNPADGDAHIITHPPGGFAGDIDMLTGRPVLVSGIAKGRTRLLRVPHDKLRNVLNRIPSFGEKLITAFTQRRKALSQLAKIGLKVIGGAHCKDTNVVREFLYKNFVPFMWIDSDTPAGKDSLAEYGVPCRTPVIVDSQARVLKDPKLQELARFAGVWRACPSETVDVAIVGAGPAGIAAAVYAASEGLSALLIDGLGPGGQAGGSSKIENFIGFPAGLSGAELATRGVLQMLKFGARMVAPVRVDSLEASVEADDPAAKGGGKLNVLHLDCGAKIKARVILVATGVRWRKLAAKNADRYEGAGVHYVCTAVEAMLYDKNDVIVVGGGNSAGQAVMHLAECCPDRRVHHVIRGRLGAGMSEYLVSRIRATANVKVQEQTEVAEVNGDHTMRTAILTHADGRAPTTLPCAGVFVFIGADPASEWLPKEIQRDKLGYVLTGSDVVRAGHWPLADRDPCPLETSLPGVLAAGDIRAGSTKRVGFAVGDGSLAVTCAHRLLSILR